MYGSYVAVTVTYFGMFRYKHYEATNEKFHYVGIDTMFAAL